MLSKPTVTPMWLIAIALCLISCSSLRSQGVAYQPMRNASGSIIINQSGQTYINKSKIVVGLNAEDFSYKRATTIIKGNGRELEVVRDCSAIAAIKLNGDEQDTLSKVNNVTIINRDTIEIHTKAMVEKYRNQIRNQAHPERPYQYLRFLGMMSEGEGNQLINEGVIDIVFDHDPNTDSRVYGFGICGNANSTFINRGKIRFLGAGSPLTRMRGMGSMADNVTFINDGTISIDVAMSEDSRMITSGGDYNEIINNGVMKGNTSGTLLGMTRYGNSHIVNNGTIDLTIVKMPDGYKSVLANSEKFVAGMLQLMSAKCIHIPPLNNKGNISITLNNINDNAWAGYGIYVGMVSPCRSNMGINNDGIIHLNQQGSTAQHAMTEAGFNNRTQGDTPISITIGNWRTLLRNFKTDGYLFSSLNAVSVDFSKANIQLLRNSNKDYSIAPDDLMHSTGKATLTGYDKINFISLIQQN